VRALLDITKVYKLIEGSQYKIEFDNSVHTLGESFMELTFNPIVFKYHGASE
jgi:hypothetical protein